VQDLSKDLGLTVQEITPEIAQRFDLENAKGVVVTGLRMAAPRRMRGSSRGHRPGHPPAEQTHSGDRRGGVHEPVKKIQVRQDDPVLVERGDARLLLTVKNR